MYSLVKTELPVHKYCDTLVNIFCPPFRLPAGPTALPATVLHINTRYVYSRLYSRYSCGTPSSKSKL
jgi:hypothetical protein